MMASSFMESSIDGTPPRRTVHEMGTADTSTTSANAPPQGGDAFWTRDDKPVIRRRQEETTTSSSFPAMTIEFQQQETTRTTNDDDIPYTVLLENGKPIEPQGGFRKAPKKFKDVIFAVLFVAHLFAICIVLITYEPQDPQQDWTYAGVWQFVWINSVFSIGISTLTLVAMATFAEFLVQIALVASVLATLVVAVRGCVAGSVWLATLGFVAFGLGVCYARLVWKRIPFAAANLGTAISAIQTNFGVIVVAYVWLAIAFGWTLLWMNAAGAAMNRVGWGIIFLYLLSFFWTQQVIQNMVHVIVAYVIGAWWYEPEGASWCWDRALNEAIVRATTYNLGSIAMGSLIAAVVQALQHLNRLAHAHHETCSFLVCVADCLVSCVEGIVEYFNKWAYTYVGIHGEDYTHSGKAVAELFVQRGWSMIITDTLADGVTWIVTLAVALLTGLTGWASVNVNDDIFVGIGVDADRDNALGFSAGFLIGFLMASILMNVVSAGVNAIIVCFAEAPAIFNKNHPDLADDLLVAWVKSYPEECNNEYGGYTPPPPKKVLLPGDLA